MIKGIITLFALCFFTVSIYAQDIDIRNIESDTIEYHPQIEGYFKKSNILLPISEVIGINFGLCAFNKYVSKEPFAKISFGSVIENFKTGFVWDNDFFVTNQFAHPYHGSLYFNSARSNGYTFWESVPFTLGGSLMWETTMETDPPQTNDLISTTLGGIMLGEMTHRLSSLVLDESTYGFDRFTREFLGAIINPPRGFNRILRGDINRHTKRNVNDVFPVSSRFSLGYANVDRRKKYDINKDNALAELVFMYKKDLNSESFKPFEIFRLKLGIDARTGEEPSSWVDIYGILYGKNLARIKDKALILGVFQDFDFFNNSIYKLGAQSAGIGLIVNAPISKHISFSANVHNNFIILSALNSIYRGGENRDYDFLMGDKVLAEGILDIGPVSLQLEYKLYWMKSLDGIIGTHTLGFLNPKLFLKVYKGFGAGAEFIYYHRHSVYKKIEVNNLDLTEHRFYLSYWF